MECGGCCFILTGHEISLKVAMRDLPTHLHHTWQNYRLDTFAFAICDSEAKGYSR